MRYRAVTCLITLATLLSQSAGELVIAPRNTEAKVGDTTYFNCSTDLQSMEIFWHHGLNYIYTGETILKPYNGRFEIDRNASKGSHNLVIHSVQPNDAGEYICIDDDGHGAKRSAELIVLDNDPMCQSNIPPDGVIGENIFKIEPDEVQLTCNVTYYGNIPPQMEWKKIGDDGSAKDSIVSMSNVSFGTFFMHTLKLKGNSALDNSSFVCQTTRTIQHQYKCTSEIIKVLYFLDGNMIIQKVFRGDEITCSTSGNTFLCLNQWHHDNDTFDETITTHLPGEYLCTLKCHVRGQYYHFEAQKAFVTEATTSPPASQSGIIAALLVIPIVIIVLVGLIAVYIRHRRKLRPGKPQRMYGYQQMLDYLLTQKAFTSPSESKTTYMYNDDVAEEEEIELLHKICISEESTFEELITGIAILDEKLFIIREKGLNLEVYDFNNFNIGPKLVKVKGFREAGCMCSCTKNNCLYIRNYKYTHVEVVKMSTKGKILRKWLTNEVAERLSVAEDGNVIVTVKDDHMLLEYLSNGQLKSEIILPDHIHPWHAIKRGDRYIVCHGMVSDAMHGVCIVDQNGAVEKSVGRGIGSAADQFNLPYHLAIGSNGCVIVSDLLNNRMMLLNSNLEFKAKIVPQHNQRFLFPGDVVMDEQRLVLAIMAGDPVIDKHGEEGDSLLQTEDASISTGSNGLSTISDEWKIEKDCRLLVFDCQPLLQQYNDLWRE